MLIADYLPEYATFAMAIGVIFWLVVETGDK